MALRYNANSFVKSPVPPPVPGGRASPGDGKYQNDEFRTAMSKSLCNRMFVLLTELPCPRICRDDPANKGPSVHALDTMSRVRVTFSSSVTDDGPPHLVNASSHSARVRRAGR